MARFVALRLLLLAAAVPALLGAFGQSPRRFGLPNYAHAEDARPLYESELLPRLDTTFVHGATMAELRNGDLAVAWYAGSDEVQPDVSIYMARRDRSSGRWSEPRIIEDREHAQRALRAPVKSVGNPVLFADEHGLRLFYVAILFGGWSGGTICMKSSTDGIAWTPTRHVVTSPFLNLGMLVRGAPVPYADGSVALPIYHELTHKWSAVARVDREGRVVDEARIDDRRPLIQPWLVATGHDSAVMFLRFSSRTPGCVNLVRTTDGGGRWFGAAGTPLVNRDSAVAATRLGDGSLLVFYNNTVWDRRDLSVARSPDGGVHWSRPHPIEHDTRPDFIVRHEYSYPYVLRSRDGRIHVVYTWQRTRICHLTFNEAWVLTDPLLAHSR